MLIREKYAIVGFISGASGLIALALILLLLGVFKPEILEVLKNLGELLVGALIVVLIVMASLGFLFVYLGRR